MVPTDLSTLSLHDALPICRGEGAAGPEGRPYFTAPPVAPAATYFWATIIRITAGSEESTAVDITALQRSEEHTSELQSRGHLVCRLLLEKQHILDGSVGWK